MSIRSRMSSSEVKLLQRHLNEEYGAHLKVDGHRGNRTAAALRDIPKKERATLVRQVRREARAARQNQFVMQDRLDPSAVAPVEDIPMPAEIKTAETIPLPPLPTGRATGPSRANLKLENAASTATASSSTPAQAMEKPTEPDPRQRTMAQLNEALYKQYRQHVGKPYNFKTHNCSQFVASLLTGANKEAARNGYDFGLVRGIQTTGCSEMQILSAQNKSGSARLNYHTAREARQVVDQIEPGTIIGMAKMDPKKVPNWAAWRTNDMDHIGIVLEKNGVKYFAENTSKWGAKKQGGAKMTPLNDWLERNNNRKLFLAQPFKSKGQDNVFAQAPTAPERQQSVKIASNHRHRPHSKHQMMAAL